MAQKVEINPAQKQEVKQVALSYLKWFVGASLLAVLGTIGAWLLNVSFPLTGFQARFLQVFSCVLEVTSLGQCGYVIQTWGGASPAEKLNQKLFTMFSLLGFFLVIFSFQLESVQ